MNRQESKHLSHENKIAVIIDAFTLGGAQRNLELIIPVWINIGYEVSLILIQDSNNELNLTELASLGLKIERIRAKSMLDFRGALRLLWIMKSFRGQLTISNLYWSQIWGALVKIRIPSIRLVWVEHNTYLNRTYPKWVIYRLCSIVTHRILGVSQEIAQFLRTKGIQNVSVIGNAVAALDLNENIRRESNTILFVGRLNNQKNPLLALRVFLRLLNESHSHSQYKFRIAGTGPLIIQMQEFVLQNSLKCSVEFLGFLEKKEIAREMSAASVLLMTSDQEGSPLVRLEALERGMCIVTTRTSGLLGVLVEPTTDQVRAPGIFIGESERDLVNHLKKSFDNLYWTHSAINARRSLVINLSPEIIAQNYLNVDFINP